MPRSLSENVARLERGSKRKKRSRIEWLQHVDVVDFLENFDVANITEITSDQIRFSCPFPGHTRGDMTPSAFMNNGKGDPHKTTYWKCFGCGRSGNAIDFVSEYLNVSRQQARQQIKAHYAPGYISPKYGSIAREFEARYQRVKHRHDETTVDTLDWETAKRFDVDWSHYAEEYRDQPDVAYMLDRGFTPAVLEEWRIGYDDDSSRITIPVCDPDGDLLGFKGRAWRKNARPKYLVIGDKGQQERYGFDTYDKSLVVFGLDKWGEVESYVLVEGELDVISLWAMDIPAICVGGSSMSTAQAKLIREYCDEVVLFFDNDPAGKNGLYGTDKLNGEHSPGIIELLEPFLHLRIVGKHRRDANDYLVRGEQHRVHELISSAKSSYVVSYDRSES